MRSRLFIATTLALSSTSFASFVLPACGGSEAVDTSFDDQQVIIDFADEVVVPTYTMLAERAMLLADAAALLAADPSQDNLDAAQAAWVAARKPWEQSEGFLFGPVDSFGYDPAMDSWPVNRTDLDAVLASGDTFTPEYILSLQETQKGFHTIEYLLFGEGSSKTAAELDPRELEYLVAVTSELSGVAGDLALSWTDGIMGMGPYRDVVATAGQSGNTAYPSSLAAAQQILDGMIGICDEVANGKIADPYDAHDPTLVESQFSFNSLEDFSDNIIGVRNVWRGDSEVAGTDGRGIGEYVSQLDPALHDRVEAEIAAALAALAAIPAPFRDAITNPDAYPAIEAAQQAITTLQITLEGDVARLVLE